MWTKVITMRRWVFTLQGGGTNEQDGNGSRRNPLTVLMMYVCVCTSACFNPTQAQRIDIYARVRLRCKSCAGVPRVRLGAQLNVSVLCRLLPVKAV